MGVRCELYLCSVNRLDIQEDVICISQNAHNQRNTLIMYLNYQDCRGLNPRLSANDSKSFCLQVYLRKDITVLMFITQSEQKSKTRFGIFQNVMDCIMHYDIASTIHQRDENLESRNALLKSHILCYQHKLNCTQILN